ncbi:MAG: toxin [Deltaproteobacteria bacterium]|nr:toxin [Deltaproteobacteria bacterium]
MAAYRWSKEKNEQLKRERDIGFDEILDAMAGGGLLDTLDHPNKSRYKGQKIFVVECGEYVYAVPFKETENEIFLKTIIPSRKYRKKYKKEAS